jgi:hypothetical protein
VPVEIAALAGCQRSLEAVQTVRRMTTAELSRQRLITIDLENRVRDLRALGSEHADATEVDYLSWWLVTKRRMLDALAADLSRVSRTPITAKNIERWLRGAYIVPRRRLSKKAPGVR